MAYDNTNGGILSKVLNRKSDNHPEYTGSINVAGVEYWLDAYVNEGKAGGKMEGRKYFKLSVKPKNSAQSAPATSAVPAAQQPIDDDSIPF